MTYSAGDGDLAGASPRSPGVISRTPPEVSPTDSFNLSTSSDISDTPNPKDKRPSGRNGFQPVPNEKRARDLLYLILVVFFSGIASVILSTITIIMSRSNGSSSALVVGLETLVGVAGGIFVIVRFTHEYRGSASVAQIQQYESLGAKAEAILFILFALVSIADAIVLLLRDEENTKPASTAMVTVLALSAFQGALQFALQTHMARQLGSFLAQEDAVGALTGALMSLAAAMTAIIVQRRPNLRWLDQTLCLTLSFMLLCFGMYYFCTASESISRNSRSVELARQNLPV